MPDHVSETCIFKWKLPLPWALEEIKPELYVHSNKLGELPIVIKYDDNIPDAIRRLHNSNLLNTKSLVIITHGFENDINSPWMPEMKDRVLSVTPDATVILVNWGGGANIGILKYSQAAANTQTVGVWLALVAREIRSIQPDPSMKIWGIAHSLGAHLMGLAGRESKVFDRITGLDPAGPSFEKVNQENRLCNTDANMVDVIHTDGYDSALDPYDWLAPVNHYGTLIPLGKIDFYPNWGFSQPGAEYFTIAGSHHRAIEYFLWSITNPGKFITNTVLVGKPEFELPVKDVKYVVERVEMGYHFNGTCEGLFFIETTSAAPWIDKCTDADGNADQPCTYSGGEKGGNEDGHHNGYFSNCRIV